jgi:hypothetical protein
VEGGVEGSLRIEGRHKFIEWVVGRGIQKAVQMISKVNIEVSL